MEDRLDRMGYLLGHLVKSQKKVSKKLRSIEDNRQPNTASASAEASGQMIQIATFANNQPLNVQSPSSATIVPDATKTSTSQPSSPQSVVESLLAVTTIDADPNPSGITSVQASSPVAEQTSQPPNLSLTHQASVSVNHIHPLAAISGREDARRQSIDSEYTSTESEISGVSDLTLSDLNIDEILRPGSIYSLASTISSTPAIPASIKRGIKRMPTLYEILNRRTRAPWSLFDFYIYMRDVQRSVDYLDFWQVFRACSRESEYSFHRRLDVSQHTVLCHTYVRGIRHQILSKPAKDPDDSDHNDENVDLLPVLSSPSDTPADAEINSIHTISSVLRSEGSRFVPDSAPNPGIHRADIRASAERILYTYLLPGAEREIIIPQFMVNSITEAIEEQGRDDPEVFVDSLSYVFQAMERDAYPFFMTRRRAMLQNIRRSPLTMFRNFSGKYGFEPIAEE
jgi:Regulator of G protein signaling domain